MIRFSQTVIALFLSLAFLPATYAADPVHGLAMHGKPKYGADFKHFDYVNPDAPKGGTLRLGVVSNGYDSFNPFVLKGVGAAGLQTYAYDTLLKASADEPFTMYGLIAESLETPEDRSYVIFHIRPQARFSDGQPITAEDVAYSYQLLTEHGHPFFRNYYAEVSSVEVLDKLSVRFDFGDTSNHELPLILGQMPILPRHYWEKHDFESADLTIPVSSGPYTIGKYEPGRSVTYVRNKDYWADDLPVNVGYNNFDRIHYDYYSDDTVALEAFKAGNFDFRVESSAKNWATAYEGDALASGRISKEAIHHGRPAGMQGFAMNTRRFPFNNRKVRQALAYGFDFQWANTNLFYDQYSRTESYFENSELASTGLPTGDELALLEPYRDQLPPEVFTETYEPPSTAGDHTLRDNLRTAMKLLQEAGFEIRDGKMVETSSGKPLRFQILLWSQSFERVVLPFKQNLAKLGIDVEVRLVDTSQYIRRVRDFDFDMIVQTLGQSDSPGNEQRDYWYSGNADQAGSRNYMGVKDPVVDALVNKLIQATDRQSLVTRTRALDRVLLWGFYVIPQWYLDVDRVAYWNKLARPANTPKAGVDVSRWWIKP
ncbi:extracellular solute-binding protein [Marinobacter bohaiensis]|uniref:extracellular solute-binding protein n=1 Tax=Marinobacter bohaiensis TaxID=2201898 RepID=UPI000DAEC799|nr:extracellular solute-binding protein [Marinobacter bohaiensis]